MLCYFPQVTSIKLPVVYKGFVGGKPTYRLRRLLQILLHYLSWQQLLPILFYWYPWLSKPLNVATVCGYIFN